MSPLVPRTRAAVRTADERLRLARAVAITAFVAAALSGFAASSKGATLRQADDAAWRLDHGQPQAGLSLPTAAPGLFVAETSGPEGTTDRLVIRFHAGTTGAHVTRMGAVSAARTALARQGVAGRTLRFNAFGAHVVQLDRPMTVVAATALARAIEAADWTVASAEPDLRLHAMSAPSDPMYASQWDYHEATAGLNLPAAWDLSTGSGVVVAVLDTGVRPHADLAANLVDGYDFVSSGAAGNDGDGRDADASDPGDGHDAGFCGAGAPAGNSSWHGTHVSGTIAAVANNGQGGAGIAYDAKVMPVRVLGRCGGYMSDIADALVWATGGSVPGVPDAATPARVVNLSLGGSGSCASTMQAAVVGARLRGAVVVVAAGNENRDARNSTPANCVGVLSVAASTRRGGRAPYSNYGPSVTLAAPGGSMSSQTDPNGILSTLNDGARGPGNDIYAYYQGTSMATPHVAGVAALMMALDPGLTGDEVISLMRAATRPLPLGCVAGCGAGLLDGGKAVGSVLVAGGVSPRIAEGDSNASRLAPQAIASLPVKVAATISSTTDVDTYQVSVPAHATFRARLLPNPTSVYSLTLMGGKGAVLSTRTNGVGRPEGVSYVNPNATTSTWYVQVKYVSGGAGPNARYTLEMFTQ